VTRLELIGPARLIQDAGATSLTWHRPTALIAYLACQPGWVGSDELAAILRTDGGTEPARAYLQRLVYRLKELRLDEGVEVEPQRLRWVGSSDVRELVAAADERRWGDVMRLYRGRFLDGAGALGEAALDDWLGAERDRVRTRWRVAVMALIDAFESDADRTSVAPLMQQLAEDDPLDEEGTQFLLQRARTELERKVALAAYDTLQRRLTFELALKPVPATRQLADALRTRTLSTGVVATLAKSAGESVDAVELTSFVGREEELGELEKCLRATDTRLVTLLGVDGAGKTRLARRVLQRWQGRAVFVDLAQVDSERGLYDALTDALSLPATDGSPRARLADWLAVHELLLVLDNFEQLLPCSNAVAELARRAPRVRWLITSSDPLDVAAEHRVELAGLPITPGEASAGALFLRHAARHGYVLTEADESAVARIGRAVDGSPLAIELAAHWLPVLTPTEIGDEIERDLGFLQSEALAGAPGHRSTLRAVFNGCWQWLQPEAQRALGALSIFHGGFSRQAAAEVAAVGLHRLLELAGKSLVRRESAQRFALHPVLRQFAAEKLDADARRHAELQHARHFLALTALRDLREGTFDPAAIAGVQGDFASLVEAWRHACENGEFELLEGAFPHLKTFLHQRRRNAAAVELYDVALAVLPAGHALREPLETARILAWLNGGELEQASVALDALDPASLAPSCRFEYETGRAMLASLRGDFNAACVASDLAMAAAEQADDLRQQAQALLNLASMDWMLGEPDKSERYAERAIAASEALGANLFLARAQRALSVVRRDQDRFDESRALIEASTRAFEAVGETHEFAYNLRQLSFLMTDRDDHAAQLDYALRALAAYLAIGSRVPIAQTRFAVGFAYKENGDRVRALETLRRSLREAIALELTALALRALVELASLIAPVNRALALESVLFSIDHPGVRATDRSEFEVRLRELAPREVEIANARMRLKDRTLATLAEMVLAA
jgi:predicted ATPase